MEGHLLTPPTKSPFERLSNEFIVFQPMSGEEEGEEQRGVSIKADDHAWID